MTDIQHNDLISFQQALAKILAQCHPIAESEDVALTAGLGRITARPIRSPLSIPPYANSAMDGYAVRLADIVPHAILPIAGKALAGAPFNGAWPTGTAIRIMTGAPLPDGCEAVIMQEHAQQQAQGVRFTSLPVAGQNIRRAGEEIDLGTTVFEPGVRLGIAELALLASLGITHVPVWRKLKIALFSTGDELQALGTPLKQNAIYDTNRFALGLMLQQMGFDILDLGIIRDDPDALRAAFHQADAHADLVITSGGVSVGEADFTHAILAEIGRISVWKLAIKPGKPFAFGQLQRAIFCGLPGNPVSAIVTFYQLVLPLLAQLSGHSSWRPPLRQKARTLTPLKKRAGRLDFQRGIVTLNPQGELQVATSGDQGSHLFSTFTKSNAFIVLEAQRGPVSIGEWVDIELFNPLLRSF